MNHDRSVVRVACEIAVIAAVIGLVTWPGRTSRAASHAGWLAWIARRTTRIRQLTGFPTAAERHAELARIVDHVQQLDPAAADADDLERLLDRHAELLLMHARVATGDELARAQLRRDARSDRSLADELDTIDNLLRRLALRVEDSGGSSRRRRDRRVPR